MGERYPVETVSRHDLFSSNNAPNFIDYFSVETEGLEFEILRAFDFQKYDVKIIAVGHNLTMDREEICGPLESREFSRVFLKGSLCGMSGGAHSS
jgi:Methyltransferase FkbM domain